MNLTVIASIVSGALCFGLAWNLQQGRFDHAEKQRLEIAQENERIASRVESQRSAQNIAAQNARALRESQLRADAAASSAVVTGMRGALAAAVQTIRDDPATCADTAATFGVVLSDISGAYSELAGTCDRHVSDIKTLIDSYPKE